MSNVRIWVGALALGGTLSAACGLPGPSGARGPAGVTGPHGEAGDPGAAHAGDVGPGGVFPNTAVLGRRQDLAISVHGVDLTGGCTEGTCAMSVALDFGLGISLVASRVVSPTTVHAEIAVAPTAAAGARDVSLTAAGKTFHFSAALTVTPAAKLQLASLPDHGQIEQGGLAVLEASNLDPDRSFDCTYIPGLFALPNASLGGAWTRFLNLVGECSNGRMHGLVMFAPSTPPQVQVNVLSGQQDDPSESFVAEPLTVRSRAPEVLVPGVPFVNRTLPTPLSSALYRVTVNDTALVTVAIEKDLTAKMLPVLTTFQPGDTFEHFVAWDWFSVTYPVTGTVNRDVDIVVWDGYGSGGPGLDYTYKITATVKPIPPAQRFTETEPNGLMHEAHPLDPNTPNLVSASFAGVDDIDRYKLTLAAKQRVELVFVSDKRLSVVVHGSGAMTKYHLYDQLKWTLVGPDTASQELFISVTIAEPITGATAYQLAVNPL